MPLRRLILLLSLLAVAAFIAGGIIYHVSAYHARANAERLEARDDLRLAGTSIDAVLGAWRQLGRSVATLSEGLPADTRADRLPALLTTVDHLEGIALPARGEVEAATAGRIGSAAFQGCADSEADGVHLDYPVAGQRRALIHCVRDGKGQLRAILATGLGVLEPALTRRDAGPMLLTAADGRVISAVGIERARYPVADDGTPRVGDVELNGRAFSAVSTRLEGIADTHLVLLIDREGLIWRFARPILAPAGGVYLLLGLFLVILARTLYRAADHEVRRREETEKQLRRSEALYRELSISDPLTGLYNRRKFHLDLHHEVTRNRRYDHPLSVAMLDLDDFKPVNDRYGHDVGDRVLRQVGHVLRGARRRTDAAYRVGGEEFVLILPETTGADALRVVERIQKELAEHPVELDEGETLTVSLSAGIAEQRRDEDDRALFNRADAAMYETKRQDRGGVRLA